MEVCGAAPPPPPPQPIILEGQDRSQQTIYYGKEIYLFQISTKYFNFAMS